MGVLCSIFSELDDKLIATELAMWAAIIKALLLASYSYMVVESSNTLDSAKPREEKHFSLFSVVTFKNDECTSLSSVAGGATTGTCYSTTECSDKSGTASGNCAAGFGVCCVFLNTAAATASITENRTHLRNAEYPTYATATAAQSIVYTINKMNADSLGILLIDETGTGTDTGTKGTFNEGWSLDTDVSPFVEDDAMANMGLVDSLCSGDYVEIPSSFSSSCGGGTASAKNAINTRYCGARLGMFMYSTTSAILHNPVCDCSEPFHVRHVTDTANDTGGAIGVGIANAATTVAPRGFCLDFRQTPCWSR